jgi:hypothetical protein
MDSTMREVHKWCSENTEDEGLGTECPRDSPTGSNLWMRLDACQTAGQEGSSRRGHSGHKGKVGAIKHCRKVAAERAGSRAQIIENLA